MTFDFRNYMPLKEERRLSENALEVSESQMLPALSLHSTTAGKVGLALSGGGFRASFFHIGVLANLADHGILRHVEVISAVSGGSIVATVYYLHLKRLLESVPDSQITDDHYRSIVSQMEQQFLAAVERNFRLSTFVSIRANWKMRRPDYSRTDRIGELYDAWLFRPTLAGPDGKLPAEPIAMRDLKIFPADADKTFHPRRDNRGRSAKVPILLINTTNLNTGRNWRFEAARMGEAPPRGLDLFDVDKVPRLQRPDSYDKLPDHLANIPLGKAVAASTAVPGLLHPLPLSGLYPERRLQLVDGGVHDNQGLQGLLDEGCNTFIVSDASGQLEEEKQPIPSAGAVLLRANGILMSRIREEQLVPRRRHPLEPGRKHDSTRLAGSAQRVALIHMKKGLTPGFVHYRKKPSNNSAESTDPSRTSSRRSDADRQRRSLFSKEVQEALARVRTDLDSFTEIEAFSLMSDGYIVSREVTLRVPALADLRKPRTSRRGDWRFLAIEPWMHRPTPEYMKHLRTASGSLFKVFRLAPGLAWLLLGCILFMLGITLQSTGGWQWLFEAHQVQLELSWGGALLTAGALGAVLFGMSRIQTLLIVWLNSVYRPLGWMGRLLFQAILPILGAVFIKLYLLTFDRLFLSLGRFERLRPPATLAKQRTTGLSTAKTGSGINRYPS